MVCMLPKIVGMRIESCFRIYKFFSAPFVSFIIAYVKLDCPCNYTQNRYKTTCVDIKQNLSAGITLNRFYA